MPEALPILDPLDAIYRFAEVARPILIKYYGVKSCVESTRATIECLKRFGVRAEVVPVSLTVQAATASWACGLSREETENLPGQITDGCKPDQTWRGHHIAIAEANDRHYLIDASFDQVQLDDGVVFAPMVLFFEVEDVPLGSFAGFISAKLPLSIPGSATPETVQLTYKELADRTFVETSMEEIDSLPAVIDLICERMGNWKNS